MQLAEKNMELAQKQQATLAALGENVMPMNMELNTLEHLLKVRDVCVALAKVAHHNRYDPTAKPFYHHIARIATPASTVFSICLAMLYDVTKSVDSTGIDEEFLIGQVRLPVYLVTKALALSRQDFEDEGRYKQRVLGDHLLTKTKLRVHLDHADILRYDNPNSSDLDWCFSHMEFAQRLKSHSNFQREMAFDYIHELIGLASLDRMIYAIEDHGIVNELPEPVANTKREDWLSCGSFMSAHFYFGYQGYSERFYTLIFTGVISHAGLVRVELTTIPTEGTISGPGIYKPRRMTVNFGGIMQAREFLDAIIHRVSNNKYMKAAVENDRSDLATPCNVGRERLFIAELDKNLIY